MSIQELFESVIARAGRTIYGEPVSAEGRTIVPVAKFSYGFGLGSKPGKEHGTEKHGGGGGFHGTPTGFIEITAAGARYVPVYDYREMAVALAAGIVVGYFLGRRRRA